MKPRVVWLTTARSPYNDHFFAELARHVQLTVYDRFHGLASHPWALGTPAYDDRPLRGRFFEALAAARRADLVVMGGWDSLRFLLAALLLPRRGNLALWTDTPYPLPHGVLHDVARTVVTRWVFRRFDRVWATGLPGCQALWTLGCPPEKTASLPFFVGAEGAAARGDAEALARFRRAHGAEGKVAVLCAGRLVDSKRYRDAVEAMWRVGEGAVLWVAGEGPEREPLQRLAEASGAGSRVHFLGWLQPEEAALAMDACDVFLHPALLDPFPTVVLDAMARGKPVVGTASSGSVADRVVDGWNGFVLWPRDVDGIAERLGRFVRRPGLAADMGARARDTALGHGVEEGVKLILEAASDRRQAPA